MNPFTILIALLLALVIALPLTKNYELKQAKYNAEFESLNCPEMLQVDSEYCRLKGSQ